MKRSSDEEHREIYIGTLVFFAGQAALWLLFFLTGRNLNGNWPHILINTVSIAGFIVVLMTLKGSVYTIVTMLLGAFSVVMLAFSQLYWGYGLPPNFSVPLSRLEAIYFSVGTLTTAGTGNISATSDLTRGLQTIQMIIDLMLVVFAVGLLLPRLSSRGENGKDSV